MQKALLTRPRRRPGPRNGKGTPTAPAAQAQGARATPEASDRIMSDRAGPPMRPGGRVAGTDRGPQSGGRRKTTDGKQAARGRGAGPRTRTGVTPDPGCTGSGTQGMGNEKGPRGHPRAQLSSVRFLPWDECVVKPWRSDRGSGDRSEEPRGRTARHRPADRRRPRRKAGQTGNRPEGEARRDSGRGWGMGQSAWTPRRCCRIPRTNRPRGRSRPPSPPA